MILITGATGFLGSALCSNLLEENIDFIPVVRHESSEIDNRFVIKDINKNTNWNLSQLHVDVVVHTAARVHVMNDLSGDPQSDFDKINLYGTLKLAQDCIKNKVKRFIFISTIKVNGETSEENPFDEKDEPSPVDPYGKSKHKAEIELKKLCETSEMELVIIRPPLVYGPNVKGNFSLLIKAVRWRMPFPFLNITNHRSLVSVYNLVDLIRCCISHPSPLNDTFLVADDEDVSIVYLVNEIGRALGKRVFLFPFPKSLLEQIFILFKRKDQLDRLIGDLSVNIDFTKQTLNWEPKYSMADSLKKMFSTNQ